MRRTYHKNKGRISCLQKHLLYPILAAVIAHTLLKWEVGELAGVTSVKAVQESKQVTVEWQDPATWEQINALLQEINYPPEGLIQIN